MKKLMNIKVNKIFFKRAHFLVRWKDGSMVRSTGCSTRGSRLDSQHPHDNSQLSVTPMPSPLRLSSVLRRHCTHGAQSYMQIKHTHANEIDIE